MFTVLGASGFIGTHLVTSLRQLGHDCYTPDRGDPALYDRDLGHVIYCIGLTADWRERPLDAVKAHVCNLINTLENGGFESFLYLSSTRVYARSSTGHEDGRLQAQPLHLDDLYNLSKMMGESICMSMLRHTVRVVRLSNVFGNDFDSNNFLSSIIKDAIISGKIVLHSSPASEKDYVSIDDVVRILIEIAQNGQQRVYNVASGSNVSSGEIINAIQAETNCRYEKDEQAAVVSFPSIDIDRIKREFGYSPQSLLESIPGLIKTYRHHLLNKS